LLCSSFLQNIVLSDIFFQIKSVKFSHNIFLPICGYSFNICFQPNKSVPKVLVTLAWLHGYMLW